MTENQEKTLKECKERLDWIMRVLPGLQDTVKMLHQAHDKKAKKEKTDE